MTEAELQDLVADLCAQLGLAHHHEKDSRRSAPGFPDSLIVGTAILYRELKSQDGVLTVDQRRWGAKLSRAGGNWQVWRPAEWESGLIMRQLTEIRYTRRRV